MINFNDCEKQSFFLVIKKEKKEMRLTKNNERNGEIIDKKWEGFYVRRVYGFY